MMAAQPATMRTRQSPMMLGLFGARRRLAVFRVGRLIFLTLGGLGAAVTQPVPASAVKVNRNPYYGSGVEI